MAKSGGQLGVGNLDVDRGCGKRVKPEKFAVFGVPKSS